MSIASVLEVLRKEYRPTLAAEAQKLSASIAAEDWPAARRTAHRIAGTAGSYGFKEASNAARAIEEAIDANDRAALSAALIALGSSI
jgi:HPt (histidine-containing phosphotransfer) domain-containing protein